MTGGRKEQTQPMQKLDYKEDEIWSGNERDDATETDNQKISNPPQLKTDQQSLIQHQTGLRRTQSFTQPQPNTILSEQCNDDVVLVLQKGQPQGHEVNMDAHLDQDELTRSLNQKTLVFNNGDLVNHKPKYLTWDAENDDDANDPEHTTTQEIINMLSDDLAWEMAITTSIMQQSAGVMNLHYSVEGLHKYLMSTMKIWRKTKTDMVKDTLYGSVRKVVKIIHAENLFVLIPSLFKYLRQNETWLDNEKESGSLMTNLSTKTIGLAIAERMTKEAVGDAGDYIITKLQRTTKRNDSNGKKTVTMAEITMPTEAYMNMNSAIKDWVTTNKIKSGDSLNEPQVKHLRRQVTLYLASLAKHCTLHTRWLIDSDYAHMVLMTQMKEKMDVMTKLDGTELIGQTTDLNNLKNLGMHWGQISMKTGMKVNKQEDATDKNPNEKDNKALKDEAKNQLANFAQKLINEINDIDTVIPCYIGDDAKTYQKRIEKCETYIKKKIAEGSSIRLIQYLSMGDNGDTSLYHDMKTDVNQPMSQMILRFGANKLTHRNVSAHWMVLAWLRILHKKVSNLNEIGASQAPELELKNIEKQD